MILFFLMAWLASGTIPMLYMCFDRRKELTIFDIFMCLVCGLMGPLCSIYVFLEEYGNTVVVRKKEKKKE